MYEISTVVTPSVVSAGCTSCATCILWILSTEIYSAGCEGTNIVLVKHHVRKGKDPFHVKT